jgi:hypothetical protein
VLFEERLLGGGEGVEGLHGENLGVEFAELAFMLINGFGALDDFLS